jgi:uncharacterized DUF497 family protein
MKIVWDEPKREANIAKHGLDFASLTVEFFEAAHVEAARRNRFLAIGEIEGTAVVAGFSGRSVPRLCRLSPCGEQTRTKGACYDEQVAPIHHKRYRA